MGTWFCEYAWADGAVSAGVVLRTDGGRVTGVEPGVVDPPDGATRLRGLTLPAFANGHSHAFHRALRGRTHRMPDDDEGRGGSGSLGVGSFWTWREQMYQVAERLDPDSWHRLARAVFAEMVLAGYGVVGEFHYLHHAPGGGRYADPNAMGEALIAAADDAGIRLTLLDTCYLTAGVRGEPLTGVQQRFGDGDAEAWANRVDALATQQSAEVVGSRPDLLPGERMVRIGAAVHSVRAVPVSGMRGVAEWAGRNAAPLHVHVSEQPRENEDCLEVHGRTPTELLDAYGALGPATTAVHATHLAAADVERLARSGTRVCVTRTTERDLADGAPRVGDLVEAGVGLTIGSDSNAVVDPFEEVRALELDERARTLRRGHLTASALLHAATREGYGSLGWAARDPDGGIRAGDLADFTVVSLDSVRLAGWTPETLLDQVVFAATSADVTDVIVGGRVVVRDRNHASIATPAADLHGAIRDLLD